MNKEKDKNKEEKTDTALEEEERVIDADTKNKSSVEWGTGDGRLTHNTFQNMVETYVIDDSDMVPPPIYSAQKSREGLSLRLKIIISITVIIIALVVVWILL
jgi:hypothetical protein